LSEHPDDTTIRTLQANETLREGGDPVAQYQEIIARDPDNVIALNNLAWLTREQDPTGALRYARRAEGLAPDNAAVLDTLAMVELANGNNAQALRAIDRALAQSKSDPTMRYHRAMIYVALGDPATAREHLQSLLEEQAQFPESAQAEILLESLAQ
jgi:Flp pilus assembly protein TadD